MKKIEIKSGQDVLSKKIDMLGNMFFGGFSPTESKVVQAVYFIGGNSQLNLSPDMTKDISKSTGLRDNTLDVSLGRLHRKGAINKNKRIITLHPVFKDIDKENDIMIKFVETKPTEGI